MKNPSGLCMCGCGAKTFLQEKAERGYEKGEPRMYRRGHHKRKSGPKYVVDENNCWIWQRSLTTHGYGHFGERGKDYLAHRYFYCLRHGGNAIGPGVELHHLCGQRACVNPDHLLPVTRRQHMLTEGRKAFGRYEVKAS